MSEIWKDVVDFEGLYQVSSFGNFRRHPNKQRKNGASKLTKNRLGYFYASLCKDGVKSKKTIHQLVAAAFIPNFKYGDAVNHIDGIKSNNHVSNLEKTTCSYNNAHANTLPSYKKPGKSKYRNVFISHRKYYGKNKVSTYTAYTAMINIDCKRIYIGQYKDEIDAAKAVDRYLDSIGDTLRIRNFP